MIYQLLVQETLTNIICVLQGEKNYDSVEDGPSTKLFKNWDKSNIIPYMEQRDEGYGLKQKRRGEGCLASLRELFRREMFTHFVEVRTVTVLSALGSLHCEHAAQNH